MPAFRAIILVSSLLLGLYIQSVILVEANGSIRSYEKKVIGKYIIGLGTAPPSPTIGVTHFAAFVEDKETGVKYMDADIEFFALLSGLNPQKIGPYQMINSLKDPMYYEVDGKGEPESPPHEPLDLSFRNPATAASSSRMADPEIEAIRRLFGHAALS